MKSGVWPGGERKSPRPSGDYPWIVQGTCRGAGHNGSRVPGGGRRKTGYKESVNYQKTRREAGVLERIVSRTLVGLLLGTLVFAVPQAASAAASAQRGAVSSAPDPDLGVESFELPNGMTFLLVPRPGMATVSAGWVAKVGSAHERPGLTGVTHLLEHMMFKGSRTVGAIDPERERASIAEQERLRDRIDEAYREQRRRFRAGELVDPYDPAARPESLVELESRLRRETERQRTAGSAGAFSELYADAGARGLNALTVKDMTLFYVTVPLERLELWFWLESDRLREPVLRDFYTERDVVFEERRLRTESTPTGPFDEQLRAMFWQWHPYSWPTIGWPSDLQLIRRADAQRFFETYYVPENLTAALIGDFDPVEVEVLARRYFGRLERGSQPVPDVPTLEERQLAEKRMLAHCDCRPQVHALYQTVPYGHRDSYALEVLAGLLNGRSGRLYRSMVVDQGVAFSAYSLHNAMRWAGQFYLAAEAQGGADPERLLAALDREIALLQERPISAAELTKVKNQVATDAYRRLREPASLLLQLLMTEGLGDWRLLDAWAERTLAVTAEDVQRVAERYFLPTQRTVGIYRQGPPPRVRTGSGAATQ